MQTLEATSPLDVLMEDLRHKLPGHFNERDMSLLREAYEISSECNLGRVRKSGEQYIDYSLKVVEVLVEQMGLGAVSAASALLYDALENDTLDMQQVRHRFGKEIGDIVKGLVNLSRTFDQDVSDAGENFRNILLVASQDARILLVKLAQRLVHMRTLGGVNEERRLQVAANTMYLYAPLAHRLGLYAIKIELEDLSFKFRHPDVYEDIFQKKANDRGKSQQFLKEVMAKVRERLDQNGFQGRYQITSRTKSIFSTWKKMQAKKVTLEEVYDFLALRVVFRPAADLKVSRQCWSIFNVVTDLYPPKPDRIRDWVDFPKSNGYTALHVTVLGPQNRWVEVQIRTEEMHDIAERGFAAHWKYKREQNGGIAEKAALAATDQIPLETGEKGLDEWLSRIRELLASPEKNAREFFDGFRRTLFDTEVAVFTPQGQVRTFQKGSTVLDFAFSIHSELALGCIGAKVNGRLAEPGYVLETGDRVEVLTSKNQSPKPEWLDMVVSKKAIASLKEVFKQERRELSRRGQNLLEEVVRGLDRPLNANIFRKLYEEYGIKGKPETYLFLGQSKVSAEQLRKVLLKKSPNKTIKYWKLQLSRNVNRLGLFKGDRAPAAAAATDFEYQLSSCCHPLPGDAVLGFKELANPRQVYVHRATCPQATRAANDVNFFPVKVEWARGNTSAELVRLSLSGHDRPGYFVELSKALAEHPKAKLRSFRLETLDGIFKAQVELYLSQDSDLAALTRSLKQVQGVHTVERAEAQEG